MSISKKDLNSLTLFIFKNKISSFEELMEKSMLDKEKTLNIINFLEKKFNSKNFNIIFESFNKRINSKKTKTLKTKRNLIESKYNEKLSSCWN